jgi:hypothetical protein
MVQIQTGGTVVAMMTAVRASSASTIVPHGSVVITTATVGFRPDRYKA